MKTVVICAALGAVALALFPPAAARQNAAQAEPPRCFSERPTIVGTEPPSTDHAAPVTFEEKRQS